jgi:hypothetical protein
VADLGDILAAVKAVIDQSHTSYVVMEHAQNEATGDLLGCVALAREILAGIFRNVQGEAVKLAGQTARLALVADEGQVWVASGVLAIGMEDAHTAAGAYLGATEDLSKFIEKLTRAVEIGGNAIQNIKAANEMLREWYPFDDIGSPDVPPTDPWG